MVITFETEIQRFLTLLKGVSNFIWSYFGTYVLHEASIQCVLEYIDSYGESMAAPITIESLAQE